MGEAGTSGDRAGGGGSGTPGPARFFGPDGQCLELWPQRAAFDPEQSVLLVADAHFGKGYTFRRHGLAVPAAAERSMVARLDELLIHTRAQELVFLGDLLHGPWSQEAQALTELQQWRCRHPALEVHLVRGNHDRHAGDPPARLDIRVHAGPLRRGPWALVHEPEEVTGAYALAGHLHPGVMLRARSGPGLRLPCFRMSPHTGVLPAFGAFTGLQVSPPISEDRIYAILEDEGLVVPLQP